MYKPISKTRFIGKNIHYLPSCHSTNDIAAYKVRSGQSENGDVIIAGEQTSGRGQRGNTWKAEKGLNFTFSVVLKPAALPVTGQFLLSQSIALGVQKYLASEVAGPVRIKWPNDLLIGELKVAGILIENSVRGGMIGAAVAGIGINMNQADFTLPRATSLLRETGVALALPEELEKLLLCLEEFYGLLEAGEHELLRQLYREKLFGLGVKRRFETPGGPVEGVVSGVDANGRLLLSTAAGERTYDIKEISWVW